MKSTLTRFVLVFVVLQVAERVVITVELVKGGERLFGGHGLRYEVVVDVRLRAEVVAVVGVVEIVLDVADRAETGAVLLGGEGFGGGRLHAVCGQRNRVRVPQEDDYHRDVVLRAGGFRVLRQNLTNLVVVI